MQELQLFLGRLAASHRVLWEEFAVDQFLPHRLLFLLPARVHGPTC